MSDRHLRYTSSPLNFLTLSLLLALAGCGGEDAKALVEQAKSAQAKGETNAALIQLKSAIQADENHSEARLLLGKLYLARGEYAAAEKELTRARGLGQKAEEINPLIARSLLGMQEYQRILDELPLPETGPARAKQEAARAQAQLGLRQPEDARKTLKDALEAAPAEPELHFAQARLDLFDRKPDQALASLEQAIRLNPKEGDYALLKADILRVTGKPAEAVELYRAIVAKDPHHTAARLALASEAIRVNKLDEARKEVEAVLKQSPNHLMARHIRALIAFRSNQAEQAREDLAFVLKAAPDYIPAVLLAGAVEYALGSLETAETHLKKALAAGPNQPYPRRLLAAALLKRGQVNEAESTLKPLNPLESEDAATLIVAGEIALAKRNFPQAEQYFAKAAEINPDSAAIRTELGLARLAQGDAQAMADLKAGSELDPGNARPDTLMVLNLLKNRQFDQALAAIDRLEKKMPGTPQPYNFRGAALLGKNDLIGARKQFEQALKIKPDYFPAAVNLAQLDIKEGKPQAAKARYETLLKTDPKNLNAMLALAETEARANNEPAYLGWLNKAAQAQPNAIQPRSLLAQHFLRKNEPAKALALAREAYSANPGNQAALELLGNVQLAAGEKQNAKDSFSKLVERAPDSPAMHYKLAQSQMALNEFVAARKSLVRVLELNRQHTQARLDLAQVLLKSGLPDEALQQAEILKRESPSEPLGRLLEGDIHMARKNPSAAASVYEQAHKLKPGNASLIKLSLALTAAGQTPEAEKRLADWLKNHPEDHAVRLTFAESAIRSGRYKEATEHYLYLNQKLPNQLAILNNLAFSLAQQKDARAIAYAEQAYKLQPDNPAVLDTLGWALTQTGQPAMGIPHLRKALSKAPDNGDIHYHYAASLAASGDPTRAANELRRLLASGNAFPAEKDARALLASLGANPH